jgi:hypothetical protein
MSKIARYVILLDRHVGEIDGQQYHHGTAEEAVTQVVTELQEAMDITSQPDGFFSVVQRVILDDDQAVLEEDYPLIAGRVRIRRSYEDDPQPEYLPETRRIVDELNAAYAKRGVAMTVDSRTIDVIERILRDKERSGGVVH